MDAILPEYEVKEIPSRFISYPEGTKIFIQPYSFGESFNIQMVGQHNTNMMREILNGVKVEGMPKNLLTPQDILFLGLYRNLASSLHNKIDIQTTCPKCLHENHTIKTLGSIKFKDVDDFDRDVYPLKVTFNDYTMWFGFISYKDFEFCLNRYKGSKIHQLALQVVKYQKNGTDEIIEKPAFNPNSSKESATIAIERYIDKVRHILHYMVDEDKDTLTEVVEILENYGLKPIDIICEDALCKHEYDVNLEDKGVLVMPFREHKGHARDRIELRKGGNNEFHRPEENEPEGSSNVDRLDNEAVFKTKQKEQIEYFATK